jgi:hypothetical protein
MARPKKVIEQEDQEIEDKQAEASISDTPGKAAYRAFIEKYRKQNPVKYEQKKAEFERRLRGDIDMVFNEQNKTRTFRFSNTPKE